MPPQKIQDKAAITYTFFTSWQGGRVVKDVKNCPFTFTFLVDTQNLEAY